MGSQARSACADREELVDLRGVPTRHPRRRPPDDGGLEGFSCDCDDGEDLCARGAAVLVWDSHVLCMGGPSPASRFYVPGAALAASPMACLTSQDPMRQVPPLRTLACLTQR